MPVSTSFAALPRDGRDTLFLLAVVGWLVLPQLANLPPWCVVLTVGMLLWRAWLALKARPLPGRWWLVGLLAAALVATFLTHRTLLGRDAGVTLVVVLLGLKTLELRARRDALVIFFLGLFTLLTNFFYSQSLPTAAAMLVGLLGLLTALVNAHMPVGRPPLAQAAKTAAWMALAGAPLMLVLFLLFPRLAPLWGIPTDATIGRSGLSSSMQVGTLAKLALDERIALRVRFDDGAAPAQDELYFRGPVLASFDGREWRPQAGAQALPELRLIGAPLRYEVTLEPNNRPWLMVLDVAASPPRLPQFDPVLTPALQWVVTRPITDLVRYRAESHPQFRQGPFERTDALRAFVELPAGYNPRTLQWAAELRRDARFANDDGRRLAAFALDRLATGGYVYTLEPGVYGQHTADEFWFDRRQGFCEHIASAFVILMRALDVPARIVTGYQGGERNPVDGYWTVRNSDAHAWAEIWIEGRGWLRVDPTAAVAPDRLAESARLRAGDGAMTGLIGSVSPDLAARLRAAWEALNNGWNQWVLNYTQSRQLDLLKGLGFSAPSWEDLGRVLLIVIVLAALAAALWAACDRRQHDPWLGLLARARERLRAAGIDAAPSVPPRQLATLLLRQQRPAPDARVARDDDARRQAIADWLLRLEAQRYRPRAGSTGAGLAGLRREFRRLRWPLKR